MPDPYIYSLTFNAKKVLADYERGIQKALLARANIIELDWLISKEKFFPKILAKINSSSLNKAVRCAPADVHRLPIELQNDCLLHIYFRHSDEIKENITALKKIKVPIQYILCGDKETDFIATAKLFSDELKEPLYFYFAPFFSNNVTSLTVRNVANIILSLKKSIPNFSVKPLPGLELVDQNIDSSFDLEPLIQNPDIELNLNENSIEYSFIIPTHNSKHFLVNVLAHIFTQDFPLGQFEVIVVDDGGTDGSMLFVESYLKSEKIEGNFRYFYWPKPPVKPYEKPIFRAGLCRNLGANLAKGKYLIFLDSDILIPNNFLNDLESCFRTKDVIQYVRHHIKSEKSNSYIKSSAVIPSDLYIEEESYWRPYFEHNNWQEIPFFWKYTCTYCLALRKSDFFSVGRFRRAFVSYGFEDTDLGYRLYKKSLRFHLSKTVTLHLTPPLKAMNSGGSSFRRFMALSKTAKIFFLSNLDINIYKHFENYMGGETRPLHEVIYFFGKFLRRFSKDPKKLENLVK